MVVFQPAADRHMINAAAFTLLHYSKEELNQEHYNHVVSA